jgi:hypothetical protein
LPLVGHTFQSPNCGASAVAHSETDFGPLEPLATYQSNGKQGPGWLQRSVSASGRVGSVLPFGRLKATRQDFAEISRWRSIPPKVPPVVGHQPGCERVKCFDALIDDVGTKLILLARKT